MPSRGGGQLGVKWDTSATFSCGFQYILARQAKMYWKVIVILKSHICIPFNFNLVLFRPLSDIPVIDVRLEGNRLIGVLNINEFRDRRMCFDYLPLYSHSERGEYTSAECLTFFFFFFTWKRRNWKHMYVYLCVYIISKNVNIYFKQRISLKYPWYLHSLSFPWVCLNYFNFKLKSCASNLCIFLSACSTEVLRII